MTDILADFKKSKYILADPSFGLGNFTVVLTDIAHWNDNFDNLNQWCAEHGGDIRGMTINFPDEPTLSMFILRWA